MPDTPSNFLLEPVPHAEAVRWIRGKPVVSREVFEGLLPELKGRAFVITGVEDLNVVAEIRALISELPDGGDWETQKKQIAEKLGPWFVDDDAAGGGDGVAASLARAELLLRGHGFQAYRTSARAVMDRQADVFPFRQYLTVGDEKVRPEHRALNEVVLPADSAFWESHPGGYGCRCREVSLLPEERDDILADDKQRPPEEHRVIEGARLAKLEKENKLIRKVTDDQGKPVRDPIHEWNVANKDRIGSPVSLKPDLGALKERYDPETWRQFESRAQQQRLDDGRTVWEWLNGKAAGKPGG